MPRSGQEARRSATTSESPRMPASLRESSPSTNAPASRADVVAQRSGARRTTGAAPTGAHRARIDGTDSRSTSLPDASRVEVDEPQQPDLGLVGLRLDVDQPEDRTEHVARL